MINQVNTARQNTYNSLEGLGKKLEERKNKKLGNQKRNRLRSSEKMKVRRRMVLQDKADITAENERRNKENSKTKIGKVINFSSKKQSGLHSPVRNGKIFTSSKFGEDRGNYIHKGLDIDGKAGDKIYAARKGTVVFSGKTERGGNEVVIKHDNGLVTKYSHLNELNVEKGDKVTHKTVIGTMGSTGHIYADESDGDKAHLHYEVIKDGKNIDPEPFLDNEKVEYKKGDYGSGSCGGTTSWEDFSSGYSDDTDNTTNTSSTNSTNNNTGSISTGNCSGTMTEEEIDDEWEEWKEKYGDNTTDDGTNSPDDSEDTTVYDQLRENISKLDKEYNRLEEIRKQQKELVDDYNDSNITAKEKREIEEKLIELRKEEEDLGTTIGLRRMLIEKN